MHLNGYPTFMNLWILALQLVLLIVLSANAQNTQIMDEAEVPPYSLPDPLVFQDGSPVKTPKQWSYKAPGGDTGTGRKRKVRALTGPAEEHDF